MLKESIFKLLKLDSLIDNLTGYVESRIELTKLELKEDFVKILSKASVYLVIGLVLVFLVFFVSMALAFSLAKYIGIAGGFGATAVIYAAIGIILYVYREKISYRLQKELNNAMQKKK